MPVDSVSLRWRAPARQAKTKTPRQPTPSSVGPSMPDPGRRSRCCRHRGGRRARVHQARAQHLPPGSLPLRPERLHSPRHGLPGRCTPQPGIVKLSCRWQSGPKTSPPLSYRGYRFSPDIISHAVWLYYHFGLSFRDVEDLLAKRGVTVTYEAIRQWRSRFGLAYARRLRHRRGSPGRHLASGRAVHHRLLRTRSCHIWDEVTCAR